MYSRADNAAAFAERVLEELRRDPPVRRYWLGYSGGRDSHILLHVLAGLRPRLGAALHAVHVHHGLHPDADAWERHCRAQCAALRLPYVPLKVAAAARGGESPEAAARAARYTALVRLVERGDCLLTAHHQDDQAETVLLQLLRGCGPRGLAAMPRYERFGAGAHARPLLGFGGDELGRYAAQAGLRWIEDPSNRDNRYLRNYLRGEIVPRLRARWPATARTLARAAGYCAEAAHLLDALAAEDLAAACGPRPATLAHAALARLDFARARNLLRYWLRGLGLPLPNSAQLARVAEDILRGAGDAMPCVRWADVELRRHRGLVYALRPLPPPPADARLEWDLERALALPGGGGTLRTEAAVGAGLRAAAAGQGRVAVRFRRGGERCRLAAGGPNHALKKLLQSRGVPPWERARLPLVYVGEELAAVADLWVCEPWRAGAGEEGLRVVWERRDE